MNGMQLNYDIVVAGGGPSGLAAAIAARYYGARVLIVEREGVLGGMSTAGQLTCWCGSADSVIFSELLRTHTKEIRGRRIFDPEELKSWFLEAVQKSGADVLYHAVVAGVERNGDTISAIQVATKCGIIRITAKYFIDSTGDGDLAYLCKVPFDSGRDGDGLMQPMTLMFQLAGLTEPLPELSKIGRSEEYKARMKAYQQEGKLDPEVCYLILVEGYQPGTVSVNMTNAVGRDGSDPLDWSRAEEKTRQQIPQIVDFLRKEIPGFERCFVTASAFYCGARETRRFHGEYCMTAEDIAEQRDFPDWIVRNATYHFGIHSPTGNSSERPATVYRGGAYTIPYRSFLPKGVRNLFLNGRNICGTHVAHGSYRVVPICFAMGQGIGLAAAQCVQDGTVPEEVNLKKVQQILQKEFAVQQ